MNTHRQSESGDPLAWRLRQDAARYQPDLSPQLSRRLRRAVAAAHAQRMSRQNELSGASAFWMRWLAVGGAVAAAVIAALFLFQPATQPSRPQQPVVKSPDSPTTQRAALALSFTLPSPASALEDVEASLRRELDQFLADARGGLRTVANVVPSVERRPARKGAGRT